MTFNDSNQMNSRKQVSNGYDDTSTGDEQIRGILQFQEIVDGTTAGNPGLKQEDGYHRGQSWTGAGGRIPPRGILDWSRRTDTTAGNPGLVQEDGQAMRRTEDEDNTLGMTQKVSERFYITKSRERSSE